MADAPLDPSDPTDPPHDDTGAPAFVRLMGTPAFIVGGRQRSLPRKAFVLLAILALSPGHTASRARIRSILWGNSNHANAGSNIRQLLTRLARAERSAGVRLIQPKGEMLRLDHDADIDLLALAPAALRQAAGEPATLIAIVNSYTGELLSDVHPDDDVLDEWLSRERANLKTAFVTAAVTLLQNGAGSPNEDIEIAARLLAVDPSHEAGFRARIRAFGLKGDVSRSRAAYLECERILKSELGILPSAETRALASRFFDIEPVASGIPAEPPARGPGEAGQTSSDGGRPRVVILPPVDPFDNPRMRGLANFLLEDITVGLARFRSFRVIAAHTAIAMASGAMRGMNTRNWCDYVIASSLGAAGSSFEVKFRLTDSRSSEVIWASAAPFDGIDLPGLFNLLSDRAVSALADVVERREVERAAAPDDVSAYRLFLEGRRFAGSTSLPELRRARRLFREAIHRDPGFAAARAGLARTKSMEWLVRGAPDPQLLVEAVSHAETAIMADDRDARGFREKGFALLYMKRHDESQAMFSEAANRNPNDADLLADYADALAHSGDPDGALTVLDRAMALNPSPPTVYRWIGGSIHYQTKRYYDAIALLEPTRRDPATARLLAACHAQVGNTVAARACFRLARESLPDINVQKLWTIVPNRNPADTQHYIDGLRRAGLS
ncbi:MAG TPA: tetratricopeptide repeat protein [Methylomirabilota bacterium]|nr:tetratricopeptide repeat protein [Methylomirabilota bacterium]